MSYKDAKVIRLRCGLLLLLPVVGCAYRNDPTIEMMQAEMRWLEDQVYMLEGELEQSCYDLCKCRQATRDRMIWEQAERAAEEQAKRPATPEPEVLPPTITNRPHTNPPSIAPAEPRLDADTPIVESLEDGSAVVDPGIATEIPPSDGVPVDSLPYELVPSGPFTSDCEDCGPVITAEDPIASPVEEINSAAGDGPTALDTSDLTPGELPAPMDARPSVPAAPEDAELSSDLLGNSGGQFEPIESEGGIEPPASGGQPQPADSDNFQPEPAEPQPGERPSIEPDLQDDEFDAGLSSGSNERYTIRLQSHVESAPIELLPDDQTHAQRSMKKVGNQPSVDAHVTHIVIDAIQQEPAEHYATLSDHDLIVFVEPRNADGEYIELPADMSVVVLDRNQSAENARVARWDLTAAEVASFIRNEKSKPGIRLTLNWPGIRPDSDELFLFVRYATIDGRKLESRQRLALPENNPPERSSVRVAETNASWEVVSSDSSGWRVVDLREDQEASDSAVNSQHATVGYDQSKKSAAVSDWTTQRVAQLTASNRPQPELEEATTKPSSKSDQAKPQLLPTTAVQDITPILDQPQADKPTWKPYR